MPMVLLKFKTYDNEIKSVIEEDLVPHFAKVNHMLVFNNTVIRNIGQYIWSYNGQQNGLTFV